MSGQSGGLSASMAPTSFLRRDIARPTAPMLTLVGRDLPRKPGVLELAPRHLRELLDLLEVDIPYP